MSPWNKVGFCLHSRKSGIQFSRLHSFFLIALVAAIGCCATHTAGATVYYVATNGLDANAGNSLAAPFLTLAKGTSVLQPGDTLMVRGGTYRETLTPIHSGTSALPITISAYSNEVAAVSGADVITNWTYTNSSSLNSTGIYTAAISWNLGPGRNQVFVDGEMMHEARYPNFGSGDQLHFATSAATVASSPTAEISSPDWAGKANGYWDGAWFSGGVGNAWSWQGAQVTNSSGTNIFVNLAFSAHSNPEQWFTGSGSGYLFGLLSMLDSDQEWFLDTQAGKLYLQIAGGANPNSHLVEVKHRLWSLSMSNVNYVTVNGLQLMAGAAQLQGTSLTLEGVTGQYMGHFQISTNASVNPWDWCVYMVTTNSTVSGCTFGNSAYGGINCHGVMDGAPYTPTPLSNSIVRNVLFNLDYSGQGGPAGGLSIGGYSQQVMFNTISNMGWGGITCERDSTGHAIFYNDVSGIALLARDTGCFYVASGSNTLHTRVAYNWFHDVYPVSASGKLLYLDNTSENYTADHNVLWDETGCNAIVLNGPRNGHCIYNNTIFNALPLGPSTDWNPIPTNGQWNPDPGTWTLTNTFRVYITNNLYLSWSPGAQLADWTADNFQLLAGTPAINAGTVIPGITDGYLGSAPDLGAYEFGGPVWVPGVNGWSKDVPAVSSGTPLTWNSTSAIAQGTLLSAGTAPTSVFICWGASDGGTNAASWSSRLALGIYSTNPVAFTPALANLTPGTACYYRFQATNSNGSAWGAAQSFTTGGGVWTANASGNWSDTNRWSNGQVANGTGWLADFSQANLAGNLLVTLDTPVTIGALRFADPTGSFSCSLGGTSVLTLCTVAGLPCFDVADQVLTITAPLAGAAGLEKTGAGLLQLDDTNTCGGAILVCGGCLAINSAIAGSSVTVGRGAALGGSGVVNAPVTVQSGGAVSPGATGLGAAGTLVTSNLTLQAGASLVLDMGLTTAPGAGVNDLICLPGSVLAVNGTVTVLTHPLAGFIRAGTYTIVSNAAAITGNVAANFSAPGLVASFSTNAGTGPYNVYMTVSNAAGAALTWQGNNGPDWDAGISPNWMDPLSGETTVFLPTNGVTFDDTAASGNVTLVGILSPDSVNVNNGVANPYNLSGSGGMAGFGGLTKLGGGTLLAGNAGPSKYTGSTSIENGCVTIGNNNALSTNSVLWLGQADPYSATTGGLHLSGASQTFAGLRITPLATLASSSDTEIINTVSLVNGVQILNTLAPLSPPPDSTNQVVIDSGSTLTINGSVIEATPTILEVLQSLATISGEGSLVVATNGGVFQVNANTITGSGSGTTALFDMSRLATATVNLGSAGKVYVGELAGAGYGNAVSTLSLATNTTITAGTLSIGNGAAYHPEILLLGAGSNIFNLTTTELGTSRDYGQVSFAGPSGSLKMRAADGASAASLVVGASSGTAYGASNQFMDLRGHTADLLLSTLTVGQDTRGSTSVAFSSNYFGFSTGQLNATTFQIGIRPGTPNSTPALWYNACDLDGGTVGVGSGGITMCTSLGSEGSASTNFAQLNISGATVTVSNNFTLATQNATAGNNAAVSTLNLTGGSLTIYGNLQCGLGVANQAARSASLILNGPSALLDLTGHAIGGTSGNPTNYIDSISLLAGTLQNVADINGTNALLKSGLGMLTLAGTNSYSGPTIVSNGFLQVTGVSGTNLLIVTKGTLGGSGVIRGPVTIQSGATLAPGISGINQLSISNSLVLQGTNLMQIARNGSVLTNDGVLGLGSVNFGGVIIVTNVGTGPLYAGDSFKLFTAANYGGGITNLVLPGGGYTWTNQLLLNGSITVLTSPFAPGPPAFKTPAVRGGDLILQGTNGNANGTYYIVASTNIASPPADWTVIATNISDAAGMFSNSIPLGTSFLQYFYRLKQ
jgi:autotransporter-associated beta strand protein